MVRSHQIFRKVKTQHGYQLEICQRYILCYLSGILWERSIINVSKKKQSTGRLTNSAWKHIQSEEAESSNFAQGIAHVSTPSGTAHVVKLQEMSCTCLEFQDWKLPCCHIIAVCKEQTLDPEDYTSQLYSVNTHHNIYSEDYALDTIWIEDLKPSSRCRAPLIQKKVAAHKKNACESHQSRKRNGIVRFAVVKITTAADVMEILKIMKLPGILVRRIRVGQLGMGLVTQMIFQILKKKVYNESPFIIFDFDSNQNFIQLLIIKNKPG